MATSIALHDALDMVGTAGDGMREVVIEDEDLAELKLSENGMIRECNKTFEREFGFTQAMLLWQHVSVLLPQLAGAVLMAHGEINHRLHYLARIGHRFELLGANGARCAVRICLSDGETLGKHYVRLTLCPALEQHPH